MNDLSRLLASSEDELELALLRSVDGDEPSAGALSKTALALGVGAALIGTAATAGGTLASASATHVAGGALGKHTGLTLFSVLKWLAAGAGAGLIASSAAHFAFRGAAAPLPAQRAVTAPVALEARPAGKTASHSPPPTPQATFVAPAAGPTTEAVASPRITPVPPESNTPAAGVAPALPTATASSASFEPLSPAPGALAAPPASTSQLTEETQALDRVRTLLEAKRPREALAELERFRKRWPAAALRAEAAVLRVEALLRLGDRASAEREADTLVRVAPHSRHAQRVRELLAR